MAVAYDALSYLDWDTGDQSWTHSPTGTPRGILVFIVLDEATDVINGVTYGGTSMTEVTGSPLLKATGEAAGVICYFLGTSVPSGAQTIAIDYSSGTASYSAFVISLTAGTSETAIEDTTTISSDAVANPSGTLTVDENSFAIVGFMSGQDAVTGVTPSTGWTNRREVDMSTMIAACYTKDANSSTDITFGWTQTSNDALAIGVAVKESGGGGSSIKTINGLAKASVKTVAGLAIASVKTWNGLA